MITINNVLTGAESLAAVKEMAKKINYEMLVYNEPLDEVIFFFNTGKEDEEKMCSLISFIFDECKKGHMEIKFFEFDGTRLYLSSFRVCGTRKNTLDLFVKDEHQMKKIREVAARWKDVKVEEIGGEEHVFIAMKSLNSVSFH